MKIGLRQWVASGSPWIWLNGAAVAVCVFMVIGILLLIAVRGLGHFWPSDILLAQYQIKDRSSRIIGEIVDREQVDAQQLRDAGFVIENQIDSLPRVLLKVGNRDVTGTDFIWVLGEQLRQIQYAPYLFAMERREWGNFYGILHAVNESGQPVATNIDDGDAVVWQVLKSRIARALEIREQIHTIESQTIGAINYGLEQLRLRTRELQLENRLTAVESALIDEQRHAYQEQYADLQEQLVILYTSVERDSLVAETMDGRSVEIKLSKVVRAYRPNTMSWLDKVIFYFNKLHEFITEEPREANTEGGIFPAIFGTVMMVLLMSVLVTPFGVIAAVYLREYARQGTLNRLIRISVNNLAGVPSIVYGVFGLGFFIYFLGGNIDQLFFPEALPAPTFGTPGLLWASLTLALLTVPVVIVATEEGLSRIPRSFREASLALGATKAETLWRVVLPMSTPAIMTGVILAVARAAGEVAPLMLVGVVKLAPSLPVDGNYPFFHLDRKFMHLGFHIYDVGFQSPNVEAARPLVYATALLLVVIIALLNFSAVAIRNRLREKYKTLEN
jgi:phosphate transport system permease protein